MSLACTLLALATAVATQGPPSPPSPVPPSPPGRTQVLLLDLESSGTDVPKDKIELIGGSMASELSKRSNLEVITAADLRAMTALEANKAASGCDQSSCLAELAAAMGARYVIYGRIGALGEELIMQVNLFDAKEGRAVARDQRRGRDLGDLSASIAPSMDALLVALGPHVVTRADDRDDSPDGGTGGAPAAPSALAITGGVMAIVGGVVAAGAGVGAASLEATLWSTDATPAAKTTAYDNAPWLWLASLGGAAVAGVGGAILLLSGSAPGDDA